MSVVPPPERPAGTPAQQAARLSMQALQRKDHGEAWKWAEQATRLDPLLEEPWLILARLAKPEDSVYYINQAMRANPSSVRARQAMHWAVNRLRHTERPGPAAPQPEPAAAAPTARLTLPLPNAGDTRPVSVRRKQTGSAGHTHATRRALTWLFGGILGLALVIGSLAFGGNWVVSARSGSADLPVADLQKPTLTPTNTPTPTPTNTPTNTPTHTPTPTDTPTNTPTPTQTNTPRPTDTPAPQPTDPPYEAPAYASDGRWIDVDLTGQMVYAYDGEQLVNSFVVSTGTWQHPTITGRFRIYVKYRYTDMSGPGYYLPDVPYTMYFYSGYGLHGTYWHNNFGTPMSHGCVNLSISDAAWLYDWASVGTPVVVHY